MTTEKPAQVVQFFRVEHRVITLFKLQGALVVEANFCGQDRLLV